MVKFKGRSSLKQYTADTQQSLEPNHSAPDKTQSDSKEGICLQSICLHAGCVGVSLSRRESEHDSSQVLLCICDQICEKVRFPRIGHTSKQNAVIVDSF